MKSPTRFWKRQMLRTLLTAMPLVFAALGLPLRAAETQGPPASTWKVGTPIVTYWAGPAMTDAVAQQMADGGFNLVWCNTEQEMDVAQRHHLRAQFQNGLLSPQVLDNPAERAKLDALVARVRTHPALYNYFLRDEPSAADFPALGRLVAYLHEHDPAHLAYINLFPTYADNKQLGTKGDTVTAYREHLRQFVEQVKPALLSYDHYQFAVTGDSGNYFLNLALVRQIAEQRGLPFLNIVQAATWDPSMRIPTGDEVRYLAYTTLAYRAQGISYYVYCCPGHKGAIALPDGTPTPLYHTLKTVNREFAAIGGELQPLRSLGMYHAGMTPPGTEPLTKNVPFRLDPPVAPMAYKGPERVRGILLGLFGRARKNHEPGKPTHVLVVNLDYKAADSRTIVGPAKLEIFDAATRTWSAAADQGATLHLPPGGGKLLRLQQSAAKEP